jgi:glyoxylase-like metal-dependent hydrolase (beta-lactamase superfamily II)
MTIRDRFALRTRIGVVALAMLVGGGASVLRAAHPSLAPAPALSWVPASAGAVPQAALQPSTTAVVDIDVVPVRPDIYMLVGNGGNTTIQVGAEGVMVVDTQFPQMSDKLLAAIRAITDKPIRWVVNTHFHPDHIGGNEALAKAGRTVAGGNVVGDIGSAATATARILAHENALNRMVKATGTNAVPQAAWPTETFFGKRRDIFFNGEAVQFIFEPNAHTDGDIAVFFRRSDVIATGDLFTTTMYPFIDQANGGSINGYVNALNGILDVTVATNVNEGGTMVIPGHGRLCDEQDVVEYRDMTTIVRDRIREYVKRGWSLEQVKAAKPTLDFDPRYGSDTGFWTTAMFIEAVYKDMVQEAAAAKNPRGAAGRAGGGQ